MPTPEFYLESFFKAFKKKETKETAPVSKILYATDREPAESDDKQLFYANKRGFLVRLGEAQVSLGEVGITWEEARRISLLKNRTDQFPLRISSINEFGILKESTIPWMSDQSHELSSPQAGRDFAKKINDELAQSQRKDVYIYVHGYKAVFDNPVLVAAELWHFLGYEGAAIAYSWPSTPKRLAYFSDIETAVASAHNFRIFLEYLAKETNVERIHIIGYSAGTRMVLTALTQLALINTDVSKSELQKQLKIGHTFLISSDFDGTIFAGYVLDGLLNVPETMTLYASSTDKALGYSKRVFSRNRLGQVVPTLLDNAKEFLSHYDNLNPIDVTGAAKVDTGDGHQYFRQSPWVSSDILATLLYGLSPEERGLTRNTDSPIWQFPDDYMEKLRVRLAPTNPAIGKATTNTP